MANLLQQQSLNSFIKQQPELCKKGWTNNVFKVERNNKIVYYLPAYLRLKVKNIISMDLFSLTGQVNCTFILSISYANMEPQCVEFISKSVELAFHKGDAMRLDTDNLQVQRKDDQKRQLLTLTLRKAIVTKLEGDIFWSPFQSIRFIISLTMRSLKTIIDDKHYLFKFNLMDCDDIDTKFSLAQQWNYGPYTIAQNQLQVYYTNQFSYRIKEKFRKTVGKIIPMKQNVGSGAPLQFSKVRLGVDQEIEPLAMKTSVQNFQYAHFILPAYKRPWPSLITIYFPLLLLGVINICIFFQNNLASGKIQLNITALIVSFIALIPTVRQNTPISPVVTFTQILVFLESFTTLLTLGHMIQYRNTTDFLPSESDGYVIACIIITAFVALSVLVLSLLYKLYWQRKYHKGQRKKSDFKFDHKSWSNETCDKYFYDQVQGIQQFIDQRRQTDVKRIQSKQTQVFQ